MPLQLRLGFAVVMIATFGTALVLMSQLLGPHYSEQVSAWVYAFAPLGSGLLLVAAGWRSTDRGRWAWAVLGLGVVSWGLGESIWEWYSVVRQVEPPYPGVADLLYLLGYPLIFAGVLLIPRSRVQRWQRIRVSLDMVAGSVALTAVLWVSYLSDLVNVDRDAGLLEQAVNLAYPFGDLYLLVGLLILAARLSSSRPDRRIATLGAAMLITAAADMVYAIQVVGDRYVPGGLLDSLWLVAYGLIAMTALFVESSGARPTDVDGQTGISQLVVPYTAVMALIVMAIATMRSPESVLQGSIAAVACIILARQAVALVETRRLIERQRDDLISSISHEIRTPLAAMTGFAELLQADPDMDRQERVEIIDIFAEQTDQVGRIAGDLVEVTRDQLAETDLKREVLAVEDLVQSSISAVVTFGALEPISAKLEPGLEVDGDVGRLRQVLVNFLTNAHRYGGHRVHITSRSIDDGVVIEVHDGGDGVPEKHIRRIWNQFDRGAHARASSVKGSGLGLSIARQLVAAHGGDTGYRRSELLGGACFWLWLPIVDAAEPATAPRRAPTG